MRRRRSVRARAIAVELAVALVLVAGAVRGEFPRDGSNFQGKHACRLRTRVARPKTTRDVSEVVRVSASARVNGAGHSWHAGLFCPGTEDGTRIDVSETRSVEASERFAVDERAMVVRADAGLITRDLLDGLARRGFTLPAFPWFIDQTIGGAVATASHGSSLRAGSLSSQLVACTIVLADGSVKHYDAGSVKHYDEGSTSHALFNALRANVGRLGVVVDVTLRIVPNTRITRRSEDVSPGEFVNEMFRVQSTVRDCERDHADDFNAQWTCAMSRPEVLALDETQFFWYIPLGEMSRITFQREERMPEFQAYDERATSAAMKSVNLGFLTSGDLIRNSPTPVRDITSAVTLMSNDAMAATWARQWKRATAINIAPVTDEQRDSFISMTETQYEMHERFGYEQLEVGIPLTKAGDCMRAFKDALYDSRELSMGFRSQALIRFIKPETAWLSPANGRLGTMYINIEDFVKYSRVFDRRGNARFEAAVKLLRGEQCQGRLHWGKYGFPKPGCFDGPSEYGLSYCHYGCAVARLDPSDKFAGDSDTLRFSGINLKKCCGDDGLFKESASCKCTLNDRKPTSEC